MREHEKEHSSVRALQNSVNLALALSISLGRKGDEMTRISTRGHLQCYVGLLVTNKFSAFGSELGPSSVPGPVTVVTNTTMTKPCTDVSTVLNTEIKCVYQSNQSNRKADQFSREWHFRMLQKPTEHALSLDHCSYNRYLLPSA